MADAFTFKIEGLDELTKRFQEAPGIVEPILQQAVSKSAAVLASHTDSSTVPWKTGTLARSFNPADIGRLYARWFPRVDYAQHVQYGTRAHEITPKNGKALFWRGARHPVKKVNHPGTRPYRYMEKILDQSTSQLNELFKNATDVIAKVMAGNSAPPAAAGPTSGFAIGGGAGVKGSSSRLSRAISKVSPSIGARFDHLTYRPFKGAPRGYQLRLGKKFPRLFKRWNIDNM